MGIEIGLGTLFSIGSGVMSAVKGFVQAGQQQKAANAQVRAAEQNNALQRNQAVRLQEQQQLSATAQKSTRMMEAERHLGTLMTVMGERGISGASFTGLARDISNSSSLDLARVNQNYENQSAANTARMQTANQSYINTVADAKARSDASSTASWLNLFGTTFQIGGNLYGESTKTATNRKYG